LDPQRRLPSLRPLSFAIRFVAQAVPNAGRWPAISSAPARKKFQNLFDIAAIVFIFFGLWVIIVGFPLLSWYSSLVRQEASAR
jgi:hypothetical protein